MKRITKRWGADQPRIAGRAICTFAGCPSEGGCGICNHARVNNHLADIEDILGDEYDLDRLRELAEADREGRCVVLPIKVPGWGWYCNGKFPNAISAYFDYPSQVVDCMEDYVLRETKEEAEAALAKIATDCD